MTAKAAYGSAEGVWAVIARGTSVPICKIAATLALLAGEGDTPSL